MYINFFFYQLNFQQFQAILMMVICDVRDNKLVGRILDIINSQTLDFVSGFHNCLEFSQPLSCLYQAMQTRKTFSIARGNSLVLHCASLLRTIFASLARAHRRVHVQNVSDFPQT